MADIHFLPRRLDRAWGRFNDGSQSLKALLALQGNPAYNSWFDDFHGDALDARYAATVGTGTEVVGVTAGIGGLMTLTTGANANDSAGQALGLHWNGDAGVYFIARAKLDTLASSKFEIGLTDAVDDDGAVDTKATPTFTATDCALFVRDTTDDTNVTFVTNGGSVADANADWSGTFAADTYYIFEVVIQNDVASGYINGQLVGSGGIQGGNALTPWAYVETLTTATRTLTADYWGTVGPRS